MLSEGEEVLQQLQSLHCDIAILDVELIGLDAYTTARLIKQFYPQVKVILLADNQKNTIRKVLKTGVYGYVLKTDSREELNKAIQRVMAGSPYYSSSNHLAVAMHAGGVGELQAVGGAPAEHAAADLTKREIEVIALVAKGCSSLKIADLLDISLQTVHTHRRNLIRKIGVRTAMEITKFAIKNGFVE